MKKTLLISVVLLIAAAGVYLTFFKAPKKGDGKGAQLAESMPGTPMGAASVVSDTTRPSAAPSGGYSAQTGAPQPGGYMQVFMKKEDPNAWRYGQMPDAPDRGDGRHTGWLMNRL